MNGNGMNMNGKVNKLKLMIKITNIKLNQLIKNKILK